MSDQTPYRTPDPGQEPVGGPGPRPDRDRRMIALLAVAAVIIPLLLIVFLTRSGGEDPDVAVDPVTASPTADATVIAPSTEPGETGSEASPTASATEPTPGSSSPATGVAAPITVADLGRDVLVAVDGDGGANGEIEIRTPDGSSSRLPIATPMASSAVIVPDGDGGFAWQSGRGEVSSGEITHVGADGTATVIFAAPKDTAESYRLVGGRDRELIVEHLTGGDSIDTASSDLLAVTFGDGADPEQEVLIEGIGGWESGVLSAARDGDEVVYAASAEASQFVTVDTVGGERDVLFEGGESTAEYADTVASDGSDGFAVVGGTAEETAFARLLVIDLGARSLTREVDVPLGLGAGDTFSSATAISAADGRVLVNRSAEGSWLAPLVYDVDGDTWSVLEITARVALS